MILVDIRACRVRKDRPFTTIVDKINSQFILYLRPLRTNLIGNPVNPPSPWPGALAGNCFTFYAIFIPYIFSVNILNNDSKNKAPVKTFKGLKT